MRIRFGYLVAIGAIAAMVGAPTAAAQTGQPAISASKPTGAPAAATQQAQTPMTIAQRDHSKFKLIWPGTSCQSEGAWGTDIMCQSPGNVQINDSLPAFGGGFVGGFW